MKRNNWIIGVGLLCVVAVYGQKGADTYVAENIEPLSQKAAVDNKYQKKIKQIVTSFDGAPNSYEGFRKKIAASLPIEVFSEIFDTYLAKKASITAQKRVENFLQGSNLNLSDVQKKEYIDLLYAYTRKELEITTYYAYQPQLIKEQKTATIALKKQAVKKFVAKVKGGTTSTKKKSSKFTDFSVLEAKAKKAGIDKSKIEILENIYKKYEQKLAELAQQKEENTLSGFNDGYANKKLVQKNFKIEIKSVLSLEEFGNLYQEQLAFKIKENSALEYQIHSSGLKLDETQKEALKKVTHIYAEKVVIAKEYYQGNSNTLDKKEYMLSLKKEYAQDLKEVISISK